MSIKPLGKRVLLELINKENRTQKGLYLTSEENDMLDKAVVVSVGNDILDIKENDVVLIDKNLGLNVNYNSKKYLLIEYDNLIAKVENNE